MSFNLLWISQFDKKKYGGDVVFNFPTSSLAAGKLKERMLNAPSLYSHLLSAKLRLVALSRAFWWLYFPAFLAAIFVPLSFGQWDINRSVLWDFKEVSFKESNEVQLLPFLYMLAGTHVRQGEGNILLLAVQGGVMVFSETLGFWSLCSFYMREVLFLFLFNVRILWICDTFNHN